MTDKAEVTQEKEEVVETKEVVKPETAEPSPMETEAMSQGWVPKEEWVESGRDPDEWRPAREFVERGELYRTIHSTKRDLKATQAALSALQRHHQHVFEKAHQQALADLRAAKRMAIREEDHERAAEIDEEIERTKDEFQTEKTMQEQSMVSPAQTAVPEFNAWVDRNPWYTQDEELREFADATGLIYANKNRGVNPVDVLKHVEASVRKKFPEKFGVKRAAPNAVASVSRQTKVKPSKDDDIELDETEREIMETLVRSGALTKEQYIADLKKVKKNG